MVHQFIKLGTGCSLLNNRLSHSYGFIYRRYHWVYRNGEEGYDENEIESRFTSLSPGGSIDLKLGEVSVVTINNPEKRNALTGNMLVEMRNVVKQLWKSKTTKAVVLCGKGDAFCSGLDFGLATQLTEPQDGTNMCMYMQNTMTLFQLLPCITVAAIKGGALGGGAEVATAADYRLMFPDSMIQFVHKKMGIIPGWGGVSRLRDIVGSRKTMHLLASSMQIDCKSSLLIGLADALVSETDEEDLSTSDVAEKWLEQTFKLCETDASVLRAIKAASYDSTMENNRTLPLFFKLKREKDILSSVWGRTANKKALNKVRMKNS
uniref:ethylmalonyl-CoA decarboxylase-like n=1 Tax=Styela clava TaxID=7725 RepID=UPI00193A3FDC|nr:ethylmalonyl-CoA decarboxylase-like [Styela clava]